jgi:hypothetical protein
MTSACCSHPACHDATVVSSECHAQAGDGGPTPRARCCAGRPVYRATDVDVHARIMPKAVVEFHHVPQICGESVWVLAATIAHPV